jgi:hypothetical protein
LYVDAAFRQSLIEEFCHRGVVDREGHVLVSAELRWFWRNALPDGIETWFRQRPIPAGGGGSRSDEYVVDARQTELGLKKRGGGTAVEIKGLVAVRGPAPAPFDGAIQIWSKWTSDVLTIDHLPRVVVHKTRWVRKFDTSEPRLTEIELDEHERPRGATVGSPGRGCQVEIVALRLDSGAAWWSVGFEAFGDLATVEDSVHRTAAHLAPTIPFAAGLELSYPAWLTAHVA